MHQAVGTSAVLGFFIALPGAISYIFLGINIEGLPPYSLGYVNILIVALVISTSIFTANIGAKLSSRISKEILKKIFAIFLLFTCTSLVIEHFIIWFQQMNIVADRLSRIKPSMTVGINTKANALRAEGKDCLLYTSPSPRD